MPRCDVNGEAPFEGLRELSGGAGGVTLFEESKTTEILINHEWSALVTCFHHI